MIDNKLNNRNTPTLIIVELETQTGCNRRCSYCPNSFYTRKKNILPTQKIEQIIKELKIMQFTGQLSLHFYNEPLLDDRICYIVSYIKKQLPKSNTLIYSNGDFLTKELFLQLINYGVDKFLVTKQEENIGRHNLEWRFELPEQSRTHLYYQTYEHTEINYTNRGGSLPDIGIPEKPLDLPCFLPDSTMTISATGNVVLCFEDYFETQIMGNVFEDNIYDIWTGKSFSEARQYLNEGKRSNFPICDKCNNTEYSINSFFNYTQQRLKYDTEKIARTFPQRKRNSSPR
jgi:radical SAM protein with 4Fe4S-binding SPASM domain